MPTTASRPAASKAKPASKAARRADSAATKPMDAIRLLKADHAEVKGWFKEYETIEDDAKKRALVQKICGALTVHTQIEEEIFYPAARAAIADDDLLDEAEVEHTTAKQLIAELLAMKPDERLYDAKVTVLAEYVDHHVEEEESELFLECRDSKLDLKALGTQMAARKAELTANLAKAPAKPAR